MSWPAFILFVHIVAACIWIGGQITLAAVIPLLRGQPALVATVGRRFAVLAWSAYGILIATGVANAINLGTTWSSLGGTSQGRLLLDKLGLVAMSGLAAAAHSFIPAPRQRTTLSHHALSAWAATLGAVSLLTALAAALYGVVIAQGP